MTAIEASRISVRIKSRDIIHDLSFACDPGQAIAITGPSGCGKTTLLNALGRLLPISGGSLHLNGVDASRWSERQCRRFWQTSAAFVLQDYGLVDEETIAYNVTLTKPLWGRARASTEVLEVLDRVGLGDRANDPAIELSGGERRRVAIARAMYRRASIIFADEPTASLDEHNRSIVQDLLLAEAQRASTVVIATHDLTLASACDKAVQLPSH